MLNWDQNRSNLCDLVHNLVHLFRHDHPFTHNSTLKSTILDDLVARIYEDLEELSIQTQYEIEQWSTKQAELKEKRDAIDGSISSLEGEVDCLEKRVVELREYNDKLIDWLRHNKDMASTSQVEIVGEKSKMADCRAIDKALDDVDV
ncbi:Arginine--tRNA ligase [Bienertia sinuspersici]